MKRKHACVRWLSACSLTLLPAFVWAGHFVSNTAAGFWHDPGAWTLVSGTDDNADGIPSGTDSVEIAAGHLIEMHAPHTASDVTIYGTLRGSTNAAPFDLTHTVQSVTVKNGGVLELADGREVETITFNVTGNVTIEDGGLIKAAAFGNQSTIVLNVGGSLIDQKTTWFSIYGGATNAWTLKFTGPAAPVQWSMVAGASSDLNNVVVDVGKILEVVSPRPIVLVNGGVFKVESNATLRLKTGAFFYSPSGGTFQMEPGATLALEAAHGLDNAALFQGAMTVSIPSGTANFEFFGTGGQNAGVDLPAVVNDLNISTPDWVTLNHDVSVNGLLTMQGLLNANGYTVYASANDAMVTGNGWVTSGTLARTFDASVVGPRTFPVGTSTKKLPVTVDVTTAGTGFGFLRVALVDSAHANPPAYPALGYYYALDGSAFTGFAANLTFQYDEADLGGIAEADLKVVKYDGSTWSVQPSSVDAANNRVTALGVSSFSDWALAKPYNSAVADWTLY